MEPSDDKNVQWNTAIEELVKSQGEKALSLSWLHNRCEKRYSYLNNYLAIPSIVLSTVVATVGGIFAGNDTASYASSVVSIVVSVLSTLNSYFLFAKRAEAHRITAISYSKLYLQISIELSLPRSKRMRVKDFLKVVSEQIQRLNEIQPQISDIVIIEYNKKFKDEPHTISRPEITNGLVDIKIYLEDMPMSPTKPEIYAFDAPTITLPPEPEPEVKKEKVKPPFK